MGLHFPVSFIILIRLVNIFCYCEEKSCCVVILLIFGGVEIPKLNIIFKGVSEGGRRGGVEVFLRRPIIGTYCSYKSLVQKAFQGL